MSILISLRSAAKFARLFRNPAKVGKNFDRFFSDHTESSGAERKGLVLGVYDGECDEPVFTKAAQKFNEQNGGKLYEMVKAAGPELIHEGVAKIFTNIGNDFWVVSVAGLGKQKRGYNEVEAIDEGLEAIRVASAIGSLKAQMHGATKIFVEGMGCPEQAAEGAALALWRYQENKAREHWTTIPSVEMYEESDGECFQRGLLKAESQNFARRLCDTPANQMTPLHFAQETVNELCPCGIKVAVHDKNWLETKKMQAVLTVARGSCEPPVFLEISYCGGPADQKPVLFAGKGITFDSGGLCLKSCQYLERFRADMTGAAAIVATIRAAASLSLPINIEACIPLCENMPSGMAMKCGDVVTALNGKTIMISNTAHEGRVILADALVYGQQMHKPRLVIDVASLTSGIRAALGSAAAGVFCNSQTMWSQVRKAGVISGDRVWRMPLWKFYSKRVTTFKTHDVNNMGKGHGAPCLAAAFLQEFIDCVDWIHFDTGGVGLKAEHKLYPYLHKGRMTGRPTRTLIQLLYQLACPSEDSPILRSGIEEEDMDSSKEIERNFDTSKFFDELHQSGSDEELDKDNITPENCPELSENCKECGQIIPIVELISHMDYHLAVKLSEEIHPVERRIAKEEYKQDVKPPAKKRKVSEGFRSIQSFYKTQTIDPAEITEICTECNKRIKIDDMATHLDYHAAKKLHLELNSPSSKGETINNKHPPRSSNNSSNAKQNKKSVKGMNITSFFKQIDS